MSETGAAAAPFGVEHDLNSVIHRFSSWKNRHEATDHGKGLRDLTYDEAARSSRFKHNSLNRDRDNVVAATAAVGSAAREAVELTATFPQQEDLKPAEGNPNRKSLHSKASGVGLRHPGGAKLPAAEVRKLLRSAVASLAQTKPALAVHAQPDLSLAPTFATALIRASSSEALAQIPGDTLEPATDAKLQTVPLTLPAADWELIRARASEADLSISDYVRQCALEVEQLRALVDRALKAARTSPATVPPVTMDEAVRSLPSVETLRPGPVEKAASMASAPAGMLTRLGSLFARRGTRVSVTA